MDREAAIILTQTKSAALGVLLTLFFGGFGVFYASVTGGIVMSLLEIIGIALAVLTLGLGSFLLFPLHIVAVIWVIIAVNKHNQRLIMRSITSSL